MELFVMIRNRIARSVPAMQRLVCGNSDICVSFDWDAEWDGYPLKTAYVLFRTPEGICLREAEFSGNRCLLPAVHGADLAEIGLYAGDIRTAVPARIACAECITDIPAAEYRQMPDFYDLLLARLAHQPADIPCSGKYLVTADGDYLVTDTRDYLMTKE